MYIQKLGLSLSVFSAPLMDKDLVHVLPEQPLPAHEPRPAISNLPGMPFNGIGTAGTVAVELDEQCEQVCILVARISVQNEGAKKAFQDGGSPGIEQISPCVMQVSLSGRTQDVAFPFPVIGSKNKLRLARKSLYIEVGDGNTLYGTTNSYIPSFRSSFRFLVA